MNFLKNKRKKKRYIAVASSILTLAIIVGICAGYVGNYYRADQDAIEAYVSKNEASMELLDDGNMVFKPETATKGFIFYPGGKVEYSAYEPLMAACAQNDILCILVQMPFNLAVLDINAAEGIQEQYPEIETWYIGGHSLGGSMAASYLSDHPKDYDGLILLGSYSTADLSKTDLNVLSVYGSEDKVMNRVKYDENKSNLPNDFEEAVIDGGCHAYFGMYGKQDGDGKPTITNEKQISLTVEHIMKIMEQ